MLDNAGTWGRIRESKNGGPKTSHPIYPFCQECVLTPGAPTCTSQTPLFLFPSSYVTPLLQHCFTMQLGVGRRLGCGGVGARGRQVGESALAIASDSWSKAWNYLEPVASSSAAEPRQRCHRNLVFILYLHCVNRIISLRYISKVMKGCFWKLRYLFKAAF